jgi:hypothetical protein
MRNEGRIAQGSKRDRAASLSGSDEGCARRFRYFASAPFSR